MVSPAPARQGGWSVPEQDAILQPRDVDFHLGCSLSPGRTDGRVPWNLDHHPCPSRDRDLGVLPCAAQLDGRARWQCRNEAIPRERNAAPHLSLIHI
eukprot:3636704-Lingulodinium_polyedra.AAC.1